MQGKSIHLAPVYAGATPVTRILINGYDETGDSSHGNDTFLNTLDDTTVAITAVAYKANVLAGIARTMYEPSLLTSVENLSRLLLRYQFTKAVFNDIFCLRTKRHAHVLRFITRISQQFSVVTAITDTNCDIVCLVDIC